MNKKLILYLTLISLGLNSCSSDNTVGNEHGLDVPPDRPTNVVQDTSKDVKDTQTQIAIKWKASSPGKKSDGSDDEIIQYKVQFLKEGEKEWKEATTIPSPLSKDHTSAIVSGLVPNTKYNFRVEVLNSSRKNNISEKSEEIKTASAAITPTVPDAPTAVKASAGTDPKTQINISWSETSTSKNADGTNAAITGYKVKYSDDGGSTWKYISSPLSITYGDKSATISGLSLGTAYQFKVLATNATGDSDYSDASNSITTDSDAVAPSKPVITVASIGTDANNTTDDRYHKVKVSWTASTGAKDDSGNPITPTYTLHYKTKADADFTPYTGNISGNSVDIDLQNLSSINNLADAANRNYEFKVEAKTTSYKNNSTTSDVKEYTTPNRISEILVKVWKQGTNASAAFKLDNIMSSQNKDILSKFEVTKIVNESNVDVTNKYYHENTNADDESTGKNGDFYVLGHEANSQIQTFTYSLKADENRSDLESINSIKSSHYCYLTSGDGFKIFYTLKYLSGQSNETDTNVLDDTKMFWKKGTHSTTKVSNNAKRTVIVNAKAENNFSPKKPAPRD